MNCKHETIISEQTIPSRKSHEIEQNHLNSSSSKNPGNLTNSTISSKSLWPNKRRIWEFVTEDLKKILLECEAENKQVRPTLV